MVPRIGDCGCIFRFDNGMVVFSDFLKNGEEGSSLYIQLAILFCEETLEFYRIS